MARRSERTSTLRQAGRVAVGSEQADRLGYRPGESSPAAGSSLTTSWPLVGRREELAFVSTLLRRGAGGTVLAGEAGVGKTRLARAILEEAQAKGYATAWATATQAAASIPYGALAHLLPVPESEAGGPLAFFQRAARTLVEQAEGRPLALAIDDAHLLDGASAAVAQRLAAGADAFVIATVRTGEVVPDAIVALWKDGTSDYLELQPLSEDDVARLLAEALDGEVHGGTSQTLWKATRGNPLYLRELVREGLARSALISVGGVWRWRGPVVPGPRLLELIEARVGRLEAVERELLEFVGAEEPLQASVLECLAEPKVLGRLERDGLLEAVRGGGRLELRFAHPLYAEAIRARTPEIRARELHRRLAEALERYGSRRRRDLLRIAVHRLEGGDNVSADMLTEAARQAETAFDYPLAERLAHRATEAGGGVAAGIVLGRALQGQGRFAEAETVLGRLAGRARADARRSELAELRSGNLFWGLGRPTEAEEVLRQSEQAIADPSRREELLSLRVGFACAAGRPLQALDAAAPILERSGTSTRAVLRTLLHVVPGLAIVGQTERALAAADEALAAASAFGSELPFAPGHLVIGRLLALRLAGELSAAERTGTEGYERALEQGDEDSMALIAMFLGQVALEQGRVRNAARWLREARDAFRELDVMGFLPWCQADLARALALSGDPAQAGSELEEANAAQSESVKIDRAALGAAAVWVAVAKGELSEARRLALVTAEEAEAVGQAAFAAIALHDLARLGEPRAVRSKLRAIGATSQGRLFQIYSDHASALANGRGGELEVIARGFEELGALLLAAEASSEAAAAHRAAARSASARRAEVRARALLERCEGAHTPWTVVCADELTLREREVAALAASGLSNRAIADRLVLSRRTVENHLQHVYGKLGATSRAELPSLLELDTAE